MIKTIFTLCLRIITGVSILYSGQLLSEFFASGFDNITRLESLNHDLAWTSRFGIVGNSEHEVQAAYGEISDDLGNLKVEGTSCCVLYQSDSIIHDDNRYKAAGAFEIITTPIYAFAEDTLYNDIQYLFSHLWAQYPSLEVHWSGLLPFSHDFFHHSWKHAKVLLLSVVILLLFGGMLFSRSLSRTFDILLVYGLSLVAGMFISVFVFNKIYIFSFVLATLIGAVFFGCILRCAGSHEKDNEIPLPFISMYSVNSILLLVMHPSVIIVQTIFFVFVQCLLICTIFWGLGMHKGIMLERNTKEFICSVKRDTLIFYLLIGFGLFYSFSGMILDYSLSSLHQPESRILESENWIREHIGLPFSSPVLPYTSLHDFGEHVNSIHRYTMNLSLLHDEYFLSGFSILALQVLIISLSAVLTFGFGIGSVVIGAILGSVLVLFGACSVLEVPLGYFTPLFISLWIMCFYPCLASWYVRKFLTCYDLFCLLSFFVVSFVLVRSPLPFFVNAGVIFGMISVLGYLLFILAVSIRERQVTQLTE